MPAATRARASSSEDADMADAAPPSAQPRVGGEDGGEPMEQDEDNELPDEEDEAEEEPQRVRILPGSTSTAASFEFLKEGHTLGNALRYIIMKKYVIKARCPPYISSTFEATANQNLSPDVEFCAYAIPHPSEEKMNIRIQTYDTTTATAALEKGLQDLEDLCDVVSEEFWTQRENFMAAKH
ncbi:DNA-directed RNA polymerase [Xylaria palmicola]|nr:DNA-directed RNA polymerase [Xylaria palmicola]